jgi:hypothetical protein
MDFLWKYINLISWGNSVNLGHFTENSKKGDPSPSTNYTVKGSKMTYFLQIVPPFKGQINAK